MRTDLIECTDLPRNLSVVYSTVAEASTCVFIDLLQMLRLEIMGGDYTVDLKLQQTNAIR